MPIQLMDIHADDSTLVPGAVADCSAEELADAIANGTLGEIRSLVVRGKKMKRLPDEIARVPSLTSLSIEEAPNLEEISPGLTELRSLQTLNLFGLKKVTRLPTGWGKLASLANAFLDLPALLELPEDIGDAPIERHELWQLKKVTKLPDSIGRQPRTTFLRAPAKLAELPRSMGAMSSLDTLEITGTKIKTLPDDIGKLEKLRVLAANDTALARLPDSIAQCGALEELSIGGTKIKTLPPEIGRLSRLRVLNVSGCPLSDPPAALGALTSLVTLDYRVTGPLSRLPEELGALSTITLPYQAEQTLRASSGAVLDRIGQVNWG